MTEKMANSYVLAFLFMVPMVFLPQFSTGIFRSHNSIFFKIRHILAAVVSIILLQVPIYFLTIETLSLSIFDVNVVIYAVRSLQVILLYLMLIYTYYIFLYDISVDAVTFKIFMIVLLSMSVIFLVSYLVESVSRFNLIEHLLLSISINEAYIDSIFAVGQSMYIAFSLCFSVLWIFLIRIIEKGRYFNNEYDNSLRNFFVILALTASSIGALLAGGANLTGVSIFSGVFGVGLTLVFRDLLHNFIAGIIVKWDGTIREGNYIEVDKDTVGEVDKISLRYTRLKTRDNLDSIVPNSKFLTTEILNYSTQGGPVRISVYFVCSSLTNIKVSEIKKTIESDIVKSSSRILKDFNHRPSLFLNRVEGNNYVFETKFWISDPQNGISNVKSDVLYFIYDLLMHKNIRVNTVTLNKTLE